jgi:hypothetical protein
MVGLNIEYESEKRDNKSLRLFLKGGFGFQSTRRNFADAGVSTAKSGPNV